MTDIFPVHFFISRRFYEFVLVVAEEAFAFLRDFYSSGEFDAYKEVVYG